MKNPHKISWQNENETMKAIGWKEGYRFGMLELIKEIELRGDMTMSFPFSNIRKEYWDKIKKDIETNIERIGE